MVNRMVLMESFQHNQSSKMHRWRFTCVFNRPNSSFSKCTQCSLTFDNSLLHLVGLCHQAPYPQKDDVADDGEDDEGEEEKDESGEEEGDDNVEGDEDAEEEVPSEPVHGSGSPASA
jgi:hypothetical protein